MPSDPRFVMISFFFIGLGQKETESEWMGEWVIYAIFAAVRLSVRLSVCLSVTLGVQLHCTPKRSARKVGEWETSREGGKPESRSSSSSFHSLKWLTWVSANCDGRRLTHSSVLFLNLFSSLYLLSVATHVQGYVSIPKTETRRQSAQPEALNLACL